mgnify:CR=1 FL=1
MATKNARDTCTGLYLVVLLYEIEFEERRVVSRTDMNLIIDIGNTRAKAFAFEGEQIVDGMTTDHKLTGLVEFAQRLKCQRGIYSCVAHLPEEGLKTLDSLDINMLQLTGQTPIPVEIMYHTTETLGADRIAAIAGARALQPEGELLVIDSGTCITFDFLDAANHYIGGNISPGLGLRLRAMHEHTALLPLIDGEGEAPELGYDTATALRSGVVWGMKHEIEGYIRQFRKKYPCVSVFLTGGDIKKLALGIANSSKSRIFADDFIVPRGLNTILAYNE